MSAINNTAAYCTSPQETRRYCHDPYGIVPSAESHNAPSAGTTLDSSKPHTYHDQVYAQPHQHQSHQGAYAYPQQQHQQQQQQQQFYNNSPVQQDTIEISHPTMPMTVTVRRGHRGSHSVNSVRSQVTFTNSDDDSGETPTEYDPSCSPSATPVGFNTPPTSSPDCGYSCPAYAMAQQQSQSQQYHQMPQPQQPQFPSTSYGSPSVGPSHSRHQSTASVEHPQVYHPQPQQQAFHPQQQQPQFHPTNFSSPVAATHSRHQSTASVDRSQSHGRHQSRLSTGSNRSRGGRRSQHNSKAAVERQTCHEELANFGIDCHYMPNSTILSSNYAETKRSLVPEYTDHGVFFGQVSFEATVETIAWMIDVITSGNVRPVNIHPLKAGTWKAYFASEDEQKLMLGFDGRLLFDETRVWLGHTPQDKADMESYMNGWDGTLPNGRKPKVPKQCVVVRL